MKRKNYIAPTMQVVVLKHESPLLVGSNGAQAEQDNYGNAITGTWEEESGE